MLKQKIFEHNRVTYACALLGIFVNTFLTVWIAFLLKDFTNVAAGGDMEALKQMMMKFAIFLLLFILFDAFAFYFKNRFIERGLRQYKEAAFARILEKHIASFQKEPTSTYISALNNDAASIEINYLEGGLTMYAQLLMFVGGLLSMAYLHLLLTLAVIVASLLPLFISVAFGGRINVAEQQTSKQNAGFTGLVKGFLDGFSIIKSFQAEQETAANFKKENSRVERSKRHRRNLISIITLFSQTGGLLVNITVFGFGAYLAVKGDLSVGTLVAFIQLTNYVVMPLQTVPTLVSARKASATLMEKLDRLCTPVQESIVHTMHKAFHKQITFSDVSFGYADSPILDKVSLQFEKGKSYAIVGASGSGKSTLLQLLLGYHDYDGDIQLDGSSLKKVSGDDLYEIFSIIQQNVFIFDDTLKNNVTMYKQFEEAQIQEAIRLSGLSELWENRKEDYKCGENGYRLSGGEKQRISIARALLKHTPVLLMDEATAALDTATASAVEEAILQMEGMTRIVVTHKLQEQMLQQYDENLVLGQHRIMECGSFQELYKRKGYFYSLYTISAN